MSEYILCKGKVPVDELKQGMIYHYSLDNFCEKVCQLYWSNEKKEDIWTMEIDHYLTDAQVQIYNGIKFENTEIYSVLTQLLQYNLEIIMWYSDFYNDIPIVYSEQEFFKKVFNGIIDISGMCEIYVRLCTQSSAIRKAK
jgi:hypothetical protein